MRPAAGVAWDFMHDVLIIGAGPAGSMAGYLLAKAGLSVWLIDQHRFPRDKVCGECLSPTGVGVLQRAGLLHRLCAMEATWMTRFNLHAPDGRSVSVPLPDAMLGLSRWRMDAILLQSARDAGASVRQHVRCEQLRQDEAGIVRARLRDLEHNTVAEAAARWGLLADGNSGLLQPKPRTTGDFGIKAHFVDVDGPRDAVELFGVKGHYGGVAPIEAGIWNAAFSVPNKRLRQHRNLDALFAEMLQENQILRRRLARARRVSRWLASPLPRFSLRRDWPSGMIPIGGAAAAIEPIGGEGMGLALRSAEIAAETIANHPVGDVAALQRRFRELWHKRRIACRFAGMGVSQPKLCALAVEAMQTWEWLSRMVLEWTGKSLAKSQVYGSCRATH